MSSFKIIRKTNLFLILCQVRMEQVLVVSRVERIDAKVSMPAAHDWH